MKKELVDSLAGAVNTGGALEFQDVTFHPNDPGKDMMIKVVLSVVVGLVSPLINEVVRSLRDRRQRRIERKQYRSKTHKF